MFKIKLKELRENKGMSQAEFAADFGVTQSAVGNWESGSRKPNIDKIKKIADGKSRHPNPRVRLRRGRNPDRSHR